MRHIIFEEADSYPIALLIKNTAFDRKALIKYYADPLSLVAVPSVDILALTIEYNEAGKAPTAFIKEQLEVLMPVLKEQGVETIYCTDGAYFKVLTKQAKSEPHYGYVLPCKLPGYETMNVVLGVNHQALIYDPRLQEKLTLSLTTLASFRNHCYQPIGDDIIQHAEYPQGLFGISNALTKLHEYPALTVDIEGFSLRHQDAGIGTISFAWQQREGIAFKCDFDTYTAGFHPSGQHGNYSPDKEIRELLEEFFRTYKGELIFHNATYDVKVLIYHLFMRDASDFKGMLEGLDILTARMHDTKIIAYLATNSTAGNHLGLKALAHEFAGNWAVEDIEDIRRIPLNALLRYNLVDALSTWYVYSKYYPIMVRDQQEDLYNGLFKDSLKLILQIELMGMPIDLLVVGTAKDELDRIAQLHRNTINDSPIVKMLNLLLQHSEMESANAKLKVKQHPLEHFKDTNFNPNSGPQTQRLLYEVMGLPVIDRTATRQPATGSDTLKKLRNHTKDPLQQALIDAIRGFGKANKILTTFIPAFQQAAPRKVFGHWVHGSFNLGGTVSGRLSSSDPNMQNIPSNSTYAKLIKKCFKAPSGWLFVGADFNSLEDMISALTTKDPNKLKVYTDGYDGHCLRAKAYFGDQMEGIDDSVESINSIAERYPTLRQDSKIPTFALTYQGTHHTLVANLGLSIEEAKRIETQYHDLYRVSDAWIDGRLDQACKDGYVEVAFGLRLRTPLLKQVLRKGPKVPFQASAEGRTAGNALGQSYGLLNNRSAVTFMKTVWASQHRLDIFPVSMIHDAQYYLVKDDAEVLKFVNDNLIKEMQWQELPEIAHDQVKLGATLEVYWPDWSNPIKIPNGATIKGIKDACTKGMNKWKDQNNAKH